MVQPRNKLVSRRLVPNSARCRLNYFIVYTMEARKRKIKEVDGSSAVTSSSQSHSKLHTIRFVNGNNVLID